MIKKTLLLLIFIFLFVACGDNNQDEEQVSLRDNSSILKAPILPNSDPLPQNKFENN